LPPDEVLPIVLNVDTPTKTAARRSRALLTLPAGDQRALELPLREREASAGLSWPRAVETSRYEQRSMGENTIVTHVTANLNAEQLGALKKRLQRR
jgi:hypothetical protein